MKILVISDKLYPDESGGSCTVAYELVQEWQKKHAVDIFTCYPEKEENNRFFQGKVNRYFNKRNVIKSAIHLKHMMRENSYDIVLTHSVIAWFVYFLATCTAYRQEKLYTVFHGPWHKEARLKYSGNKQFFKQIFLIPLMFIIEKLYCALNSNYIFLSRYMEQELIKINPVIRKKKCIFISGGVDLTKFTRHLDKAEAKRQLGISVDTCVLFTLRRLDKRMGIQHVIEALKMMPDSERKKYILFIGGKGEYRTALEKQALCIQECIKFIGFVPENTLNLYFCAADLFLVPSLDLEGFGLVILESLAMGVPVLATPQGGMKELKDKFRYFHLSETKDVKSLQKGISQYGNLYKNQIIQENLEQYSWQNIAKQYLGNFMMKK